MVHYTTPSSTTDVVHTTFNSFNSFQTSTVRPRTHAHATGCSCEVSISTAHRSRHQLVSSNEMSFITSVSVLRDLERQHLAPIKTEVDENVVFNCFSHPIVNLRMLETFIR